MRGCLSTAVSGAAFPAAAPPASRPHGRRIRPAAPRRRVDAGRNAAFPLPCRDLDILRGAFDRRRPSVRFVVVLLFPGGLVAAGFPFGAGGGAPAWATTGDRSTRSVPEQRRIECERERHVLPALQCLQEIGPHPSSERRGRRCCGFHLGVDELDEASTSCCWALSSFAAFPGPVDCATDDDGVTAKEVTSVATRIPAGVSEMRVHPHNGDRCLRQLKSLFRLDHRRPFSQVKPLKAECCRPPGAARDTRGRHRRMLALRHAGPGLTRLSAHA